MSELDPYQQRARQYFDPLASRSSPTWATAGWSSAQTQRRRWAVFAKEFDFAGADVIDVGAGGGGFRSFLEEQGVAPRTYIGLDLVMDNCERLSSEPGVDLAVVGTIEAVRQHRVADIVTASGVFNFATDGWASYVEGQIGAFAARSREAVLFNAICPSYEWDALVSALRRQWGVSEAESGDEREHVALLRA